VFTYKPDFQREYLSKGQSGIWSSWSEFWKLPMPGQGLLLFKAKAHNDIIVAISPVLGVKQWRTYFITLGGWNNTKSVFRKGDANTISKESYSVIRSITDDYWVLVDKQTHTIAVGRGTEALNNTMVKYTDKSFFDDVQYFAFSSWDTPVAYSDIRVVEYSSPTGK